MAKTISKKNVTIKDVALHTGFSASTISKVLSGNYAVSAQTKALVHAAAEHLGYVPDVSARNLRLGRTGQIGMVINEIAAEDASMELHFSQLQLSSLEVAQISFDGAVLAGVTSGIRQHNHQALVVFPQPLEGDNNDSRFLDGRVDGLLVRTDPKQGERLIDKLNPERVPMVALWTQDVPEGVGYADVDHEYGGYLAGQHLLELGHRRLAYYGDGIGSGNTHFELRHQGFLKATAAAGVMPVHHHTPDAIAEAIHSRDGVTGVFIPADLQCALFVEQMGYFGIAVPEDVSLVGFDDIFGSDLIAGGLTTLYHPVREMATAAVSNLIALIGGAEISACKTVVRPRLVIRQSTRPI